MKEYKIIEGTRIECQKQLNQLRHEYEIDVLSMTTGYKEGLVTIMLTREKIEK